LVCGVKKEKIFINFIFLLTFGQNNLYIKPVIGLGFKTIDHRA